MKRTLQLLEAVLVAERLRRAHISAIHAHMGLASATVAWFAAEFARSVHGRPVSWSMTVHGWSEFVDDPDAELREKAASASLVVAISDFTRSQLLRLLDPADWHKVKVVRCGIDPDRFPRRERTERGSTIVVTARLAAEKGHRVLLDAVAMLRDRGVDTTLRVIGDGPLADHLRARSRELDLDDRVQFLGAQEPAAVAAALREADVFCLPTFAEGLPVVLMEAMATGVPVITTYIAGIPELVCDGQTGRVVPAGRSDALAIALAAVLDPAADLQPMTDAARAAVLERHDARTNAVALATLLRDAHAA